MSESHRRQQSGADTHAEASPVTITLLSSRGARYVRARDLPASFLVPLWGVRASVPAVAFRACYGQRIVVRLRGHAVMLPLDARVLVADR